MMLDKEIVREYDIRGVYKKNLDRDTAVIIGKALSRYLDLNNLSGKIAVAYDGRHSSPNLVSGLVDGITSSGFDVVNLGLGPTPMLYYSNFIMNDVVAGIMITGSHNPPEYNGFKFIVNKKPFYGQTLKSIFDIHESELISNKSAGRELKINISDKFLSFLCEEIDERVSNLRIVWDSGNGATGEIIKRLAVKIPGKHIVLNTKIDGDFPSHHPDPTVEENLQELISNVKQYQADFGIAFDGDGDRIGVVDRNGKIIWGDQILAILSKEVINKLGNVPIIADVKSSKILFDIIEESGGQGVIWKTGHSNIKTKMIDLNAPLAGEMSGHIFYKDRYYGYDDAIYAAIRFINCYCQNNNCIDEILQAFSGAVSSSEIRVQCDEDRKFKLITEMQEYLQKNNVKFSNTDGIRVDTKRGWWLARASNTQDILVFRIEGYSKKHFDDLLRECKEFVKNFGVQLEYECGD